MVYHILQIGSYIHDDTQIVFTGSFGHDFANQRAQQYELNAMQLDHKDTFILYANRLNSRYLFFTNTWVFRTFSQTGFQVELKRRRTPILLQVIFAFKEDIHQ